ncbi:hypothetical protein SNEBB_008740 [Seison nebaliae]|nr:hypothetical protein SNEBB_008740 [Seison nebaliae]
MMSSSQLQLKSFFDILKDLYQEFIRVIKERISPRKILKKFTEFYEKVKKIFQQNPDQPKEMHELTKNMEQFKKIVDSHDVCVKASINVEKKYLKISKLLRSTQFTRIQTMLMNNDIDFMQISRIDRKPDDSLLTKDYATFIITLNEKEFEKVFHNNPWLDAVTLDELPQNEYTDQLIKEKCTHFFPIA